MNLGPYNGGLVWYLTRALGAILVFAGSTMHLLRLLLSAGLVVLIGACSDTEDPVEADAGEADTYEVPSPMEGLSCEAVMPGAAPVRLLTRDEYQNTIRDLVGVDEAPVDLLPPENHALGFENNAEAHIASPLLAQRLLAVAESVSEEVVGSNLMGVAPCAPALRGLPASTPLPSAVHDCRDRFVNDFGLRAFRRPLRAEERSVFNDVFAAGFAESGILGGVSFTIQAALISPQLLYRIAELAPGESPGDPVRLSGYELASRLSYFIWSSTPDDALLAAADSGELDTDAGVEAQARRLLADPRARDTVDSFHRQWLLLDTFDSASKDVPAGVHVPTLMQSYKQSVLDFAASSLLDEGGSIHRLMTSDALYTDDVIAQVFEGHDIAEHRAGLLTQPGLMALLSHPEQTSPIRRGIFVREQLMCEPLRPPPADVVIDPPDPDPNATTRERFFEHTADVSCAGCHVLIDPLGFGFEGYDELGRYRTHENGLAVDTSGDVRFPAVDYSLSGPFDGAIELGERLADSPQLTDCIAQHWYQFAMGRGAAAVEDQCNLARLQEDFRASGGDVRELLVRIAGSDAFVFRRGKNLTDADPMRPVEDRN
ncbi:MAG: hypothetical protein ACI9OJ_005922 [Myxococcota bacterium]|jgi:hypothetical protein